MTSVARNRIAVLAVSAALLCSRDGAKANRLADFGFSDEREGIEQLLREVAEAGKGAEARYRVLVAALHSDDFGEREAATQALANLVYPDRVALEKIAKTAPPEVAMRIRQALRKNSSERFQMMLDAALDVLIVSEEKGMVELLFGALEIGGGGERGSLMTRAIAASRATATADDLEFLEQSLQNEVALVRAAAVSAIAAVAGASAGDLLLVVVADPDPDVKWTVASALVKLRRRECLLPMAELLMCDEDFGVRWRSLDELRRLTGQDFGYYAAGDIDDREGPAAKWIAWVREHGAGATLRFEKEAGSDTEEQH